MFGSSAPSRMAMAPAVWCQSFFLAAAAAVAAVQLLPRDLRTTLMDYGLRRLGREPREKKADSAAAKGPASWVNRATSYGQVPHAWFWHFYLVSVCWSAFWAWQYLGKASLMSRLAHAQTRSQGYAYLRSLSPTVELGRVYVAWSMLAMQGVRRLYESLYIAKPGSTPMWFVHWALAILFYTVMGIAVWIEGSGAILASWKFYRPAVLLTPRVPSALALFAAASLKQYECHRYLARLEKYTLPTEGLFRYLVCPHYTCECAIYIAMAFVAAPSGSLFNRTLLCGLVFVMVNLAATAYRTRQWYADKFGAAKLANRWSMIPYLF